MTTTDHVLPKMTILKVDLSDGFRILVRSKDGAPSVATWQVLTMQPYGVEYITLREWTAATERDAVLAAAAYIAAMSHAAHPFAVCFRAVRSR